MKKVRICTSFRKIMAVSVLAAVFLTGCGSRHYEMPAPDVLETTFQPTTQHQEQSLRLVPYNGPLVETAVSGTTVSGGSYAIPNVKMGTWSEPINAAISTSYKNLCGYDSLFLSRKDFITLSLCGNTVIGKLGVAEDISVVYEQYTGKVLTPEEYNYLVFRDHGDRETALQAMLDWVEGLYVDAAMDNGQLSPQGLEHTLEYAKKNYHSECVSYLDAEGEVAFRCYNSAYDFRRDYWFAFMDHREGVPFLTVEDTPGALSIKEGMLAVEREATERGNAPHFEEDAWVAGRYMVFRVRIQENNTTQYHYFFLNLLTGQEETYEEIYANMGMDKGILNEMIYSFMDRDYQECVEAQTEKPFAWEHDKALYERTMAQANADDVMVIPGDDLRIVYNAYFTEDGAPEQREVTLPRLDWTRYDANGEEMAEDFTMYPGLETLMVKHCGNVGYVSYGTWQLGDTLVVVIGWYGSEMDWKGYEAVCFNSNTGELVDYSEVLTSAGTSAFWFEEEIRAYFESQPDYPQIVW